MPKKTPNGLSKRQQRVNEIKRTKGHYAAHSLPQIIHSHLTKQGVPRTHLMLAAARNSSMVISVFLLKCLTTAEVQRHTATPEEVCFWGSSVHKPQQLSAVTFPLSLRKKKKTTASWLRFVEPKARRERECMQRLTASQPQPPLLCLLLLRRVR